MALVTGCGRDPGLGTSVTHTTVCVTAGSYAPTSRGYAPAEVGRQAGLKARQARAAARGADLAPILAQLRAEGVTSLGGLARGLTARGIETPRGGTVWTPTTVSRLLKAGG